MRKEWEPNRDCANLYLVTTLETHIADAPRVLIMEDDPFIALDMELLIEDAGYEVVGPFASEPEAMKALNASGKNKRPDCALLDFYVTGGTTEHVARHLMSDGVPVIFVSGNASDVRECLKDKDPIIRSKPISAAFLIDDVNALFAA